MAQGHSLSLRHLGENSSLRCSGMWDEFVYLKYKATNVAIDKEFSARGCLITGLGLSRTTPVPNRWVDWIDR